MTQFKLISVEELGNERNNPNIYMIDEYNQKSTSAYITDFAMIKGGDSHTPFFSKEYGVYWTRTNAGDDMQFVVGLHNFVLEGSKSKNSYGIRPICNYSDIEPNITKKYDFDDKLFTVKYGYYPQELLKDAKQDELNALLEAGKLSLIYQNNEYEAYSYEDKYYAKYNGNWSINNQKVLKQTNPYMGRSLWFNLSPITWIVNKEKDIAVSKNILYAGLTYDQVQDYLDNNFAFDINFMSRSEDANLTYLNAKLDYYNAERKKIDDKINEVNEQIKLIRKKGD